MQFKILHGWSRKKQAESLTQSKLKNTLNTSLIKSKFYYTPTFFKKDYLEEALSLEQSDSTIFSRKTVS